ncbi:phosphoglycerate kinase, partial [mine drainage metagenome]
LTLQRILGRKVEFMDSLFSRDVLDRISRLKNGEILMLENTRFYSEETGVDDDLEVMEATNMVRKLSPMMDYFVNDAFPSIHRSQTTLVGFQRIVPNISGKLIEREIRSLDRFLKGKESPKIAVLAGSKINESISVARNFLKTGMVDRIMTGGVVANVFLHAKGINIGKKNRDFIVKNNKNHAELITICKDLLEKTRIEDTTSC